VTSVQFAWVIKPNRVRADEPVEFRLRSDDVNHAFALYEGNRLEVQVQAQPDAPRVLQAIESGGTGSGGMPANLISGQDAQTVARFVARSAAP
jgi:hypothetical protein